MAASEAIIALFRRNAEEVMGAATASAGAATLDRLAGQITSEALTTGGSADYTLTLTNAMCKASHKLYLTLENGSNTVGPCYYHSLTHADGTITVKVRNTSISNLNGTLVFNFLLI